MWEFLKQGAEWKNKQKISNFKVSLNSTVNQLDLINMYGIFQQENTLFSSLHDSHQNRSHSEFRIHLKFKRTNHKMFSHFKIKHNRYMGNLQTCKLNILVNTLFKESIKLKVLN